MGRIKFFKGLKNTYGFTMIEVVTVMAILAVVAAISGPSITGFLKTGTVTSNDNIARAVFLASQNALTDLYNRGELQEYVKFDEDKGFNSSDLNNGFAQYGILNATNKVPSEVSLNDGDTGNDPYIYHMMLNDNNTNNPLYKLLSPYVSDKGVLANNICIEFNAKNGIMKSAFYSDKLTSFSYGGDGDGDILKHRTTTDKLGYYGTKQTSALPERGKPVKLSLIDGMPTNSTEIQNTLYVEAFVPDNEDTYTLTVLSAENSDGSVMPSYAPVLKDGNPFAVTFKVKGNGEITRTDMSGAIINPYRDMKSAEHATGYHNPMFKSTNKYDPFNEGKAEYIRVVWVLDTIVDSKTTYNSLVSQMPISSLIQVQLTCDTTGEQDTSMKKCSRFENQSGTAADANQRFFVSTARHLNNVRYKLDGLYSQTTNIDIKNHENKVISFKPIGDKTNPFTGLYTAGYSADGVLERYSISNLVVNDVNLEYSGLFGVNAGSIERLQINAPVISSTIIKVSATGAVAGKNIGSIKQTEVTGATISSIYGSVGAIAGVNDGENKPSEAKPNGITQEYGLISYCFTTGKSADEIDITSIGSNVGGIVGVNEKKSTVKASSVSNMTIEGKLSVGGIVGSNNGDVNNVFYSYAGGENKAQTTDFIVPIKGDSSSTSAIIGENKTDGTVSRVISTAMTKGNTINGNAVAYNPIVGSGILDLSTNKCYYLTGIGYNEYTGNKLGLGKSPTELMTSAFIIENLGKDDDNSTWIRGEGAEAPTEKYPYPLIAVSMKAPDIWPIPQSGSSAITLSYYEFYSQTEMGRWTPSESTLREENDAYVIREGYGIELYDKDKTNYEITLSAVSGSYSPTTEKKTYSLIYDTANHAWKLDGVALNDDKLISAKRDINGVMTEYSILPITNTMLDGLINKGELSYVGSNLIKVNITNIGSVENIVERKEKNNSIYIQPLFGKGIYEFANDKEADTNIQGKPFAIRSPQHLMNINYMDDHLWADATIDIAKRTNYLNFKQELNIYLSNQIINKKHESIDVIQTHINKNGGLITYKSFNGIYDGNGKKIENLLIDAVGNLNHAPVGLFSMVEYVNATLKNIVLEQPLISTDMSNVGAAVGSLLGKIENCRVEGGKIRGYFAVGGLVGESLQYSEVKNSTVKKTEVGYYETTVITLGEMDILCIGGIVGYNNGLVEKCTFSDGKARAIEIKYNAQERGSVGGIAGTNEGQLKGCTISGTVQIGEKKSAYHTSKIGGIAGYNMGDIDDVTVTGEIKIGGLEGTGSTYNVGGIAGYNTGNINNAYVLGNTGEIRIDGYEAVGGIVGYNTSGELKASTLGANGANLVFGKVSIAATSTVSKKYIGGIVGLDVKGAAPSNLASIIERCAVVGTKAMNVRIGTDMVIEELGKGERVQYVGGIAGSADGKIKDCFFSAPTVAGKSLIKGVNNTPDMGAGIFAAGIVADGTVTNWGKGIIDDTYFASMAPQNDTVYYPIFSSDNKIPPGHAKTIKYLRVPRGINDEDIYNIGANNAKMSASYAELRSMVGAGGNTLPNTRWTYLTNAGNGKYPYPILISENKRLEGLMETLVDGDWCQ